MILLLIILLVNILLGCSQQDIPNKYAETITQEELKNLLEIYSSDEFEGRQTGKYGDELAANFLRDFYLKNELLQLDLKKHSPLNYIEFINLNKIDILLSYYENNNYYKSHKDSAVLTFITWFFREPKKFEGGNLKFTDYNESIEVKHNRCVIFPSFYNHEVERITMDINDLNKCLGRYTITNFSLV